MDEKTLANIRNEYKKAVLSREKVDKDPIKQFQKWFDDATKAANVEPTAMNLATCSEKGVPSTRVVLLKGIEKGNFIFYTNYQSNKGKDLDANPNAALNFFWPSLERQINVQGVVERVSEKEATEYFQSRPRESQIGAWSSPQSSFIGSRELLEQRKAEIEKRFEGVEVLPKPKQWGGYIVKPYLLEFWQGRPGRLHDRIVYVLGDKGWEINRMAP